MRQIGKSESTSDSIMLGGIKGDKCLYMSYDEYSVSEIQGRTFEKAEAVMNDTPGIIKRISSSGSTPYIEFHSGGRAEFRIRGPKLGRGAKRDRLYFDEAAQLSDAQFQKILPMITASKSQKVIMLGTPPTEEDYEKYGSDTPFIRAYEQGGPDVIYIGVGPYDKNLKLNAELARKMNPLHRKLPNFSKNQTRYQKMMSHKSYCVEYLGAWLTPERTEIHDPLYSAKEVNAMLTTVAPRGTKFTAAVGVYPDSNVATVAYGNGVVIEVVETFDVTGGDLNELIDWLVKRSPKLEAIKIPANSRGATIEKGLRKRRVLKGELLKVTDTAININKFNSQVKEGSLKVFESSDVKIALSSFWLGLIPSSGSYEIFSGAAEDKAFVLAIVNATKEGSVIKRNTSSMRVWSA